MSVKGYLKFPSIEGDSQSADHAGEIDMFGLRWEVKQKSAASHGAGLTQSRAEIGAMSFWKWMDNASPYLALMAMRGTVLDDDVIVMLRKDSGDAHLDYLQITLHRCVLSKYLMENDGTDPDMQMVREEIQVSFEKITYKYVEQAADGSAGAEHEAEYSIVEGV